MLRIAIDAMGGDKGPATVLQGCMDAIARNPELTLLCVGQESVIKAELKNHAYDPRQIEVQHASEEIKMHDSPSLVVRQKKNSSIHIANQLVKNGEAQAVFTAGNTGAAMAVSLLVLGRIPGILRPALCVTYPAYQPGRGTSLLDVGANVDSKAKMLAQFAIMGSIYHEKVNNIPKPKVGLLSLGEEPSKGNLLTQETFELLSKMSVIDFVGNIEGQDIFTGKADVAVCDGFVGNILLKFGEGAIRLVTDLIKREALESGWMTKIFFAMMRPLIKKGMRRLDYAEYGCAPLLGVQGISTIGHGKSSSKAIRNAIFRAASCVEHQINQEIEKSLIAAGVAE